MLNLKVVVCAVVLLTLNVFAESQLDIQNIDSTKIVFPIDVKLRMTLKKDLDLNDTGNAIKSIQAGPFKCHIDKLIDKKTNNPDYDPKANHLLAKSTTLNKNTIYESNKTLKGDYSMVPKFQVLGSTPIQEIFIRTFVNINNPDDEFELSCYGFQQDEVHYTEHFLKKDFSKKELPCNLSGGQLYLINDYKIAGKYTCNAEVSNLTYKILKVNLDEIGIDFEIP
jgi:hypothetical protein